MLVVDPQQRSRLMRVLAHMSVGAEEHLLARSRLELRPGWEIRVYRPSAASKLRPAGVHESGHGRGYRARGDVVPDELSHARALQVTEDERDLQGMACAKVAVEDRSGH